MIEVYIDGASAGDPGPSGAGIYIKNNGKAESFSIALGMMNNHEAEFHALIKSLEICIEDGFSIVSVRSDSTTVVDAVEKEYARNEKHRILLTKALSLASQLDLFFIKWIPSKENKHADQLARQAIRLNI
ncbi:reverse transcriptase-like protein [Bacillus sp. FJAT-49732]|uniref:Reverse transcriptase-like protein n=1 Tax=Lederbergia citrisecunda TaxID=2833583 RepID=A0A942TL46_9BACI|nr:reverse transcriptase-like protein [Lederbergia citrisecunda]MBS4199448.1 reverse transcriptase-like protein [Lederbergia citrisecunda]